MTEKVRRRDEKGGGKGRRQTRPRKQRERQWDKGVGLFVVNQNLKVRNKSRKCKNIEKKFARYMNYTLN